MRRRWSRNESRSHVAEVGQGSGRHDERQEESDRHQYRHRHSDDHEYRDQRRLRSGGRESDQESNALRERYYSRPGRELPGRSELHADGKRRAHWQRQLHRQRSGQPAKRVANRNWQVTEVGLERMGGTKVPPILWSSVAAADRSAGDSLAVALARRTLNLEQTPRLPASSNAPA